VIGRLAVVVLAAVLVAAVVLAGCGESRSHPAGQPTPAAGSGPTPGAPVTITAAGLMDKLKKSALPITQARCYTQADDPNNLLGRPGQYVDRCAWHDKRIQDPFPEVTEEDGPPTAIGGSIELFEHPGDAVKRASYLKSFDAFSPERHWVVPRGGIVLLRVSRQLTRAQAAIYHDTLQAALPTGPTRAGTPPPRAGRAQSPGDTRRVPLRRPRTEAMTQ
jgi:hypothetical protein